ncbi:MAG: IS4 family transposase [Gammaproteobacteria bacterium]|nr:MAG: IS4 family transposase [Gammaproteobacteria bacterium]
MTTNQLYHTLMQQIEQIIPTERITRKRVLAWLMTCLFLGRNSHAARLGNKIPGQAQKTSKAERLRRWLSNKAVRVRDWYEPVARQLIAQATASGQPLRLIVDGTKIGSKHQLLMVAIAYRRRALPLAWTWVRCRRGHSSARKQLALLSYVHSLIPVGQLVQLVGDSEFSPVPVLKQLDAWSWQYVLRQKGRFLVRCDQNADWQRFDELVTKVGQVVWLPDGWFTAKHSHPTTLLAIWRRGERQPWFLVTNIPDKTLALRLYTRRMWIEEMFGDFKRNGFDLEAIRLRHFLRLSRFTMAVALLYVWLVAFGSMTIKRGERYLVDRNKQRQLSIFRIGYDMLERCLTNGDDFSLKLIPYF